MKPKLVAGNLLCQLQLIVDYQGELLLVLSFWPLFELFLGIVLLQFQDYVLLRVNTWVLLRLITITSSSCAVIFQKKKSIEQIRKIFR